MIDDRIIELLDRKYAFLAKVSDVRFMLEAARFVEWLFAEDLIRPYALQVLDEDREQRDRFIERRGRSLLEAIRLRETLGNVYPHALSAESGIEDPSPEYLTSLTSFDRIVAISRTVAKEEEDIEREPERDQTTAGRLLRILQAKEQELRGDDETDARLALRNAVTAAFQLHAFHFNERKQRLLTSPARSFRTLLSYCRALNPPPDGIDDWMTFFEYNKWQTAGLKHTFEKDKPQAKRMLDQGRADLERSFEHLRALLGTSLSSVTLVSRFKERCTWFDKDDMRRLADGGEAKGVREDRLTLALARYLHDNGVFTLVRSRMGNLEPDVIAPFGPRRLAIESKVYGKGQSAKGAVLQGFWQLHSYLTSLETKTVRAHEGFLVVFRLGGAICDAPTVVALNRFRIHIVPIDLGDVQSGHAQPKPSHVSADELIEVAALPDPPEETISDD